MRLTGSSASIRKTIAFIAVGLLAFILYLYFCVGFAEIFYVLRQVNPVEYILYYSLTFVAILLSIFFYSLTWQKLMKVLSINMSLLKAFLYSWLGNFVDLVVPLETVSGELAKVYLVCRETKYPAGNVVASIVSHRIISTLMTLGGLIAGSVFLIFTYKVVSYVLSLLVIMVLATAAFIVILLYLCFAEEAVKKLANGVIRLAEIMTRNRIKLDNLREKIQHNVSLFHQGIRTFGKQPKYLVEPTVYAFVSWFFHVIIYFLVFYALGFTEISTRVSETIVVYSISMAVQTLPLSLPVGLVEIVMTSLYALLGVPLAVSGAATTLIRIVNFWFQIIIGYIIVQWIGIKNLLDKNR